MVENFSFNYLLTVKMLSLFKCLVIGIFFQLLVESQAKISKGEITAISSEIWELDQNRLGNIHFNIQEHLHSERDADHSPARLFSSLSSEVFEAPSFKYFIRLLDNYNADVTRSEDHNKQENEEEDQFLNYVLSTDVMIKTWQFLVSKNLVSSDPEEFREEMKTIWFGRYSRARGVLGSTGFEHVFVGEVKQSKVSGFHNWVHYYLEEQNNTINYGGYYKLKELGEGVILSTKFRWNNFTKAVGTFFISTTPEFEMAVYTLCFHVRPNKICKIQCNGNAIYLKAYELKSKGKVYIGSAYPDLNVA